MGVQTRVILPAMFGASEQTTTEAVVYRVLFYGFMKQSTYKKVNVIFVEFIA
jgi:hypothetical protein